MIRFLRQLSVLTRISDCSFQISTKENRSIPFGRKKDMTKVNVYVTLRESVVDPQGSSKRSASNDGL